MQIIGHNSVNVHRIPINRGTEIFLNEPFKYTKFQFDRSTHLHFMADLVKCVKRSRRIRRKKQRKTSQTLAAYISELSGAIFFKLSM